MKVTSNPDAVDPFFLKCTDAELENWKATYETLIQDNSPDSGKSLKLPHLLPGYRAGLAKVEKIIADRKAAGKQLSIF